MSLVLAACSGTEPAKVAPNESGGAAPVAGAPAGGAAGTAAGAGGGTATSGGNATAGAGRAAGGGAPAAGAPGLPSSGTAGAAGSGASGTAGSGGQVTTGGQSGSAGSGASSGTAGGPPRPTVTAAPGTTLVKPDPTARRQTFEGWGTSLCWWANHVGGWSEDARNAVVDAVVDPVAGLGYNVFRYNIGGGENPDHEHMDQHREMPGFEPQAGTWTWDADANQRAVLRRIVERGDELVLEAFSNSPPYWMTKSGCASGNGDGSNNLKDDAYDDFADYLTEVVKHYRDEYGIVFRTLEPLNEPNANWWKSDGSQEGCHFSPSNQESIILAVAAELAAKGLTGTSVSASDENSMDEAYTNLRAFDAATLAAMTQINVHSYAGSRRSELATFAAGNDKRLWQSESGPLNQTLADDTAAMLFMAGRIIDDLRNLEPAAWVDWQVGDPSRNWASLVLNDAQESFSFTKRFYMHAGFSRYIRPGSTFIEVDAADMVAAVSPDSATLVVVVRNDDASMSRGYTFDLTALPSVGAAVEARRTSRTENLATLDATPIGDFSFVVTVPAGSVTTFVVPMP
jgi:O-glycosyl hydrolase